MLKNSMNEIQGLLKLVLLTLNKRKTVKAMRIRKVDPLIPTLHAADKKPFTIIFPQHDFPLVNFWYTLKVCAYIKNFRMQTIYKECWICLGLWVIFKKQKRTLKYVLNMKLKKKERKDKAGHALYWHKEW